jgi:drug/metabolite transporter (DMT)-like permease
MNMAFVYVDVGVVTTLHFVYPMFVTLGSVLFLREKLNPIKVIALLITTSGIGCFFLGTDNSTSQNAWLGIVMALTSGITYAFYMIFIDKSGLKNINPLKVTFYVAAVSSAVMLFYGTFTKSLVLDILSPKAWVISAVFSILCTVIALSLIQVGIKNTGPSTAAILSTFEPITSVVFGSILLGESISIVKLAACLLIFLGILVLAFAGAKGLKKF